MRNFITVGAPNNGVEYQEDCQHHGLIEMGRCQIQEVLNGLQIQMFSQLIQRNVGPAGYHKDHLDKDTYINHSGFLPYLNNEKLHT